MIASDLMQPLKVWVAPHDTLRSVSAALAEGGTGLAVVRGTPPGVLSERDILRAVAQGVDVDRATAIDHMSAEPVSVTPDAALDDACDLMAERGVRHVIVIGDAGPVGVINMRDVVGVLSGAARLGSVPPARG